MKAAIQMKDVYIEPFKRSVEELFSSMYASHVQPGEIETADAIKDPGAILALITLDGSSSGTVVLSLPGETGVALANGLMGTALVEVDETVIDCIGEVLNMIAGAAKAQLAGETGVPLKLGLPVTSTNSDILADVPPTTEWSHVPFKTEFGDLSLWIALH